jgi:endothelin-converting enzyme
MKAIYDACLNETVIKMLGVSPLMDILHRVEEAFPAEQAADNVNPSDVNAIKETLLLLSKLGLSALIASGTGSDDKAPDNVVTFVSPPWTIGLPSKERYEDEKLVKKYEDVLTRVLSTLYPGRNARSLSAVVDFEKKLAAASPSTEELEDITVGSQAFIWSRLTDSRRKLTIRSP